MLTKLLGTMFTKGEEKCAEEILEKPVRTSAMTMVLGLLEGMVDIFLIAGCIEWIAGFFVKRTADEE